MAYTGELTSGLFELAIKQTMTNNSKAGPESAHTTAWLPNTLIIAVYLYSSRGFKL